MSTSKCCRKVSFGYFWMRFLGIDRETCKEANCAINWKFFLNKISKKCEKQKLIFFKQNFKKIVKNKNFYFWKFPGMSMWKCCRKVSFGYFWVRFSRIDRETCREAHYSIKWNFSSDLCLGFSDRITYVTENVYPALRIFFINSYL